MGKKFSLSLAAAILGLVPTGRAWPCAVCLSGNSDAATEGYNTSVLFLMSAPYLVVGAIIGGLIFTYRRAQKRREQTEEAGSTMPMPWKQEESGQ